MAVAIGLPSFAVSGPKALSKRAYKHKKKVPDKYKLVLQERGKTDR